MSSAEDDHHESDAPARHSLKKRRVQRACDVCRRKKIRCDGPQAPGSKCSNCVAYSYDCTYVEAAKKRGPPKGYVESLENRLEKMEMLLKKICPDADFSQELGPEVDDSWRRDARRVQAGHRSRSSAPAFSDPSDMVPSVTQACSLGRRGSVPSSLPPGEELDPSDSEYVPTTLAENLQRLAIDPNHYRFFGKSSGIMFVQTAMDLKKEFAGVDKPQEKENVSMFRELPGRRDEYWAILPWEMTRFEEQHIDLVFPEPDLTASLVGLYFRHHNVYYPLLHRPSFERNIRNGLHLRNSGFGSVLLAVCAIGSRWSEDPRVILDGTESWHSAGWKYFDQVQVLRKSLLAPPTLYDLQLYCLSVMFIQGSSAPQGCWTICGIGLRMAQDVGAHRRKVYNSKLTLEDELWKRAFWILVTLDRLYSSGLGRPCAIQDEDFDLDLPAEVDDDYLEHPDPDQTFKQPPDSPSTMSFFIAFLKLNQILAFALRTIYSINKSKVLLGFVGQQWEQHIVAELDSALNKWIDSVPDHLHWDPNRQDDLFLEQSAVLYCYYYHLQILVHRPFIPLPRKPSPLSFPSLAICTNAARSSSHVVDVLRKRCPGQGFPVIMMPVFSSCIVLLLNIWGGKRSGLSMDPVKEMAEVHKSMNLLKSTERRWLSAGRLWDILCELASVGNLPLPDNSPSPNQKRERDSDTPSTGSPQPTTRSAEAEAPRVIAGSRRVANDAASSSAPSVAPSSAALQSCFTLPIHSDELGRLPLHGEFSGVPSDHLTSSTHGTEVSTQSGMWYGTGQMSSESSSEAGPSNVLGSQPPTLDPAMSSMFTLEPLAYDPLITSYPGPFAQSAPAHISTFSDQQSMFPGSVVPPPQPLNGMSQDTIAMWSNAPTGFEWDDWGAYITNVGQTQQHHHHGT